MTHNRDGAKLPLILNKINYRHSEENPKKKTDVTENGKRRWNKEIAHKNQNGTKSTETDITRRFYGISDKFEMKEIEKLGGKM